MAAVAFSFLAGFLAVEVFFKGVVEIFYWFCYGSGALRKSLCLLVIGLILNRVLARGRSG